MENHSQPSIPLGGVVLCGGLSRRMGVPKANLPFGEERLLQRVVRLIRDACDPIVVVAAADQTLPSLPSDIRLVRDEQPELGPLEGIRQGLQALQDQVAFAFVTSCDVPFISSPFIREVCRQLGDARIAIPKDGQYHHPLAAVYATDLADEAQALLDQGNRRPISLLNVCRVAEFSSEVLRRADPELLGLMNTNDPAAYRVALHRAGLKPAEEIEALLTDIETKAAGSSWQDRSS